jgi:hypothetical protein
MIAQAMLLTAFVLTTNMVLRPLLMPSTCR